MAQTKATDLYISLNAFPVLKLPGEMLQLEESKISGELLAEFRNDLLDEDLQAVLEKSNEVDFTYEVPDVGRFRINFFTQRGEDAIVIRRVPTQIKSIKELNLPNQLIDVIFEERGLIMVVGSAGTGKSTTIAAMIDHRNKNQAGHILTLEDPIEFFHEHDKAIVNQREIGRDTPSFKAGIKNALQVNPSVLLMGEIQDTDTVSAAITFSETGHLVLGTMYASGAQSAVERFVNMYTSDLQDVIRYQLSENLKAIIAQRLIPSIEKEFVPAVEIMLPTARIKDLIRKGETYLLNSAIESSTGEGLQSFDQSLYKYYKDGIISDETAIYYADRKTDMAMRIKSEVMKDVKPEVELEIIDDLDDLDGIE